MLTKLRDARALIERSSREMHLAVDGGIKVDSIREVAQAGADFFVLGSGIFGTADYNATIAAMRAELAQARQNGGGSINRPLHQLTKR